MIKKYKIEISVLIIFLIMNAAAILAYATDPDPIISPTNYSAIVDGQGALIGSTASGAATGLNVYVLNQGSGTVTVSGTVPVLITNPTVTVSNIVSVSTTGINQVSGSVTVLQGSNPWVTSSTGITQISGTVFTQNPVSAVTILNPTVTVSNVVSISATGITQVSGTTFVQNFPASYTVNQGTNPWVTSATGITQVSGTVFVQNQLTSMTVTTSGVVSTFITNPTSITSGLATSANQVTEINNQASQTTLLTQISTSTASTANFVSGVATAANQAIMAANQTNGTQIAIANETSLTVTGSASALNAVIIPSTDVSKYSSIYLQISGTFSATHAYQVSNDNIAWSNLNLELVGFNTTAPAVQAVGNGVVGGSIKGKYFRTIISAYSSGTVSETAIFSTAPYSNSTIAAVITNPKGQDTMANSLPVTFASDQTVLKTAIVTSAGSTISYGDGNTTSSTVRVTIANDELLNVSGAIAVSSSVFTRIKQSQFFDTEEARYDIPPDVTSSTIYVGLAAAGASTASATWAVVKTSFGTSATPTRDLYKSGVVWDNRASTTFP